MRKSSSNNEGADSYYKIDQIMSTMGRQNIDVYLSKRLGWRGPTHTKGRLRLMDTPELDWKPHEIFDRLTIWTAPPEIAPQLLYALLLC
jgi:hypothetical protein